MRTLTARALPLTLVATLASACLQQQQDPQIGDAIPKADDVQIKLPEHTGGAQPQILGQIASYYLLTRGVTVTLNAGAAWVLLVVHAIVDNYPATTVSGNVYTWGPWSGSGLDPASWQLVVTANADGTFDWALQGQNKAAPAGYLTVISGHAVPGAEPGRGSGTFTIDFTTGEKVDPIDNTPDAGQVDVAYDLENRDGTPATVTMHAEGIDKLGNPGAFDYLYDQNLDGSGDFQFALHADINDNGSAAEDATIRSRWLAAGAGRADAMLSGGDLGAASATATECWDTQFDRVYYSDSVNWQPTEGDAGLCAFADQALPGM